MKIYGKLMPEFIYQHEGTVGRWSLEWQETIW